MRRDDIVLMISPNQMEASVRFRSGGESPVSAEDVMEAIKRDKRILYGIDSEAIQRAVDGGGEAIQRAVDGGGEVCIARGLEPVKGSDAEIKILFETEHNMKPRVREDGTVDYRTLDLFEGVKKGQELVRKIPATDGVPGMTVTGRIIPAKPGRDKNMPRGINASLSDDGLLMLSEADGRADIYDGKIVVSSRFEVATDVDMSVGNIDFNGDILIKGSVISGLKLRATGNVEIFGIVEGAHVEAGGNIMLRQGMQGADVGVLKAGGWVYSPFIERAGVYSTGDVTADMLVHSNVNSDGSVIVLGKKGVIFGGTTRAKVEIVTRVAGSASFAETLLEAGDSPEQRLRAIELEAKKRELLATLRRLEMRTGSLGMVPAQNEQERTQALRLEAVRDKMATQKKLADINDELSKIKAAEEDTRSGRVHILHTVFPGVQILIAPLRYIVKHETEYATYKKGDDEIVFTACEYHEGDDDG